MLLSQTSKAAIKAVAYIAGAQQAFGHVRISQMAEATGENNHTLAKLLQVLVREGIVSSSRGIGGGFFLSKTQLQQPLLKIISAIEGKQAMSGCVLGLARCSNSHPCPVHFQFAEIRKQIDELFSGTKIHEINETVADGFGFLKN